MVELNFPTPEVIPLNWVQNSCWKACCDSFLLSLMIVGNEPDLSGFISTYLWHFAVVDSLDQGSVSFTQADYHASAHDNSLHAQATRTF